MKDVKTVKRSGASDCEVGSTRKRCVPRQRFNDFNGFNV